MVNHLGNKSASSSSLFALGLGHVDISFEFFPPKNDKMEEVLWNSIKKLAPLKPSFVSVTYGAGGTTRERTHATIKRILSETNLIPAAHLTCVGASKGEVDDILREYWDMGVRHIVALRGDAPDEVAGYAPHPQGYNNAADLVGGIKKIGNFDVSVAAYPEMHPESRTLAEDLDNLKEKIDAGANRAITQFFFESDKYFRFLDHAQSYKIEVPIIPGILPVSNFKQLTNFAKMCGANVPAWMGDLFVGLDQHPKTRELVAATVASEMCSRLAAGGVNEFHFYTLNRADLSYAICHLLGKREQQ
jgi:methylenetetrahydrofolate reductase (NADPH)